MPSGMTKVQWAEKLREAGVEVPKSWSVLQIKALWAEMNQKMEDKDEGLVRKMAELKKAARKKKDLIAFMAEQDIGHFPDATILQLYNHAEKVLHQRTPARSGELVGFGQHANLTYHQLAVAKGSYLDWCRETVRESDSCSWKMERLVEWADQHQVSYKTKKKAGDSETASASTEISNETKQLVAGWTKLEKARLELERQVQQHAKVAGAPVPPWEDEAELVAARETQMEEIVRLREQVAELTEERDEMERLQARNKGRREM